MRYFTSDFHFGHQNVITLVPRPFGSVEEMNRTMIDRFNSRVSADDLTFIVGDFALGKRNETVPIVSRLNGTKILVSGNHDETFQQRSKAAKWKDRYIGWGFDDVVDGIDCLELQCGTDVMVDHFPYYGDHDGYEERYPELRPRDDGGWLLHGHVHEKWRVKDRMINVGVDAWDFYPLSEDDICDIICGFPADLMDLSDAARLD